MLQELKSRFFPSQKEKEQRIIQQIHDDIDSAEERLLAQANSILKELHITTESDIEKIADRLEKIGFSNVPTIKKARQISDQRQKTELQKKMTSEIAALIEYYKFTYPMHKFLTGSELDRICLKYGLIYAPVSCYTKDVPEKNLAEIEKAQELKEKDKAIDKIIISIDYKNQLRRLLDAPEMAAEKFLQMAKKGFQIDPKHKNMDANWLGYQYLKANGNIVPFLTQTETHISTSVRQGMFIAAPKDHFDLKSVMQSGYGFFTERKSIIQNDPIVFRGVRGGVQVLSKWGLEGKDEALFNEKLN